MIQDGDAVFGKKYGKTAKYTDSDGKRRKIMIYTELIPSQRLPESFDGMRVLHLSDLHAKQFGKDNTALVRLCRRLSPDIICFTGDIFSRNETLEAVSAKLPFMKSLCDIAPTYYIRGNHENDADSIAEAFEEGMRKIGVNVLRNEMTAFTRNGESITICGIELPRSCYRRENGSYRDLTPASINMMKELIGDAPEGYTLLLAHTPLPFGEYAEWGADLTLSGHVHGGIIRLFGTGLLSPERRFFPRYTNGVYSIKTDRAQHFMEVSAGLGKFRINNPPSVTVCILARRNDND